MSRTSRGALIVIVIVVAAMVGLVLRRNGGADAPARASGTTVAAVRVKTVHPKTGTGQTLNVEQPAEVAAYYRADLYAPVAGTVKVIEKTVGDPVKAGEVLARLDAAHRLLTESRKPIVRAPLDGVISARTADPGTFVASAAVVPGTPPLFSIMRTDIVTVSMRVPDSFAAYVDNSTEAEIRVDSFPGRALRCRLSRVAPSMSAADRTVAVEVDLYNGTRAQYDAFLAREKQTANADLKSRTLPVFPEGLDASGAAALKPGMYGRMKLLLRSLKGAAVVPSSALFWDGGVPYLYCVESGVARRARVRVESDDGTQARVYWLDTQGGADGMRELSQTDEIVLTNQGELEDGARVVTSPGG